MTFDTMALGKISYFFRLWRRQIVIYIFMHLHRWFCLLSLYGSCAGSFTHLFIFLHFPVLVKKVEAKREGYNEDVDYTTALFYLFSMCVLVAWVCKRGCVCMLSVCSVCVCLPFPGARHVYLLSETLSAQIRLAWIRVTAFSSTHAYTSSHHCW